MKTAVLDHPASQWLELPLADGEIALWWLGQAGFAIRGGGLNVVLDPYLSDALAVKYAGKEFPHTRMMPPPLEAASLRGLDFWLCTHRHGDHMDGPSLHQALPVNPRCRVVLPRAEIPHALGKLGLPRDRLLPVSDGEKLPLAPGFTLEAIPSCHEEIVRDAEGNSHFLGYILEICGVRIYHSGDCIPYPGLAETLASRRIDLALLPVNGRDEFRGSRGVPGNFTLEEALELCREAGIPRLLGHHFGMFDFNSVDIRSLSMPPAAGVQLIPAECGLAWLLHRQGARGGAC
ncbi:MAG: hypothetical protein RL095_2066 [Verrucomicrobiota bacterium]|jgi:L-ascorbate metabolism protein UlaG (beta-lactamase superfamily)